MEFKLLNRCDGSRMLSTSDDYIIEMKPFERSLKMKVDKDISKEHFLDYLVGCSLDFTSEEFARLEAVCDDLKERLSGLNVTNPECIYVIKTNGKDEFNSAYTRGDTIILPEKKIANYNDNDLLALMAHEFFHVYSRANRQKREDLYRLLGYRTTQKSNLPKHISRNSLTNPDAMATVYVETIIKGKKVRALPVIAVRGSSVDENKDILESLSMSVYIKEWDKLIEIESIGDIAKSLSINNSSCMHPEETLAENFVHLIIENEHLKDINFVSKMKEVIKD